MKNNQLQRNQGQKRKKETKYRGNRKKYKMLNLMLFMIGDLNTIL